MTKKAFAVVALFSLFLLGVDVKNADAQGFHFGGGGVHIDVGYPHGGYGCYSDAGYGGGWRGYGLWGGHSHWHDTTHLDYHPGGFVRHRNHYHYVPGHYDVHHDGHWDHHGF
jgi:hypothetical protein